MPIELGIWKLGQELQPVNFSPIDSESKLEDVLCENLSLISPDLMLIGRQIATDFGKFMDILAMDREGQFVAKGVNQVNCPKTLRCGMGVQSFYGSDEEAAFLQWRKEHPHGVYINSEAEPSERYLVLHRANCSSIDSGSQTTYRKTCAANIGELRE